jgi:hypothetical protein
MAHRHHPPPWLVIRQRIVHYYPLPQQTERNIERSFSCDSGRQEYGTAVGDLTIENYSSNVDDLWIGNGWKGWCG